MPGRTRLVLWRGDGGFPVNCGGSQGVCVCCRWSRASPLAFGHLNRVYLFVHVLLFLRIPNLWLTVSTRPPANPRRTKEQGEERDESGDQGAAGVRRREFVGSMSDYCPVSCGKSVSHLCGLLFIVAEAATSLPLQLDPLLQTGCLRCGCRYKRLAHSVTLPAVQRAVPFVPLRRRCGPTLRSACKAWEATNRLPSALASRHCAEVP